MTEAFKGNRINPEGAPRVENKDIIRRLDGAVTDFIYGYQQLAGDPAQYLIDAKTKADPAEIASLADYFSPLDESQLRDVEAMSEHLGIPLSPLGINTFTSGMAFKMKWNIANGGTILERGYSFLPKDFSAGPSSRIGLWVAQTESVSRYMREELDKDKTFTSEIPTRTFPPTREDLHGLGVDDTHEGFHGIHIALRHDFLRGKDKNGFDVVLLREGLADRTALLKGLWDTKEVRQHLRGGYFGNLTRGQNRKFHAFVDVISQSSDPDYQAGLTWRGILANSVREFLNPPDALLEQSAEMAKYSQTVALPRYRRGLQLASHTK